MLPGKVEVSKLIIPAKKLLSTQGISTQVIQVLESAVLTRILMSFLSRMSQKSSQLMNAHHRNGKPKPHYHVGYPGFSGKMMHHRDRFSGFWSNWNACHCPSAWTRMFMTKPRRAKEFVAIKRIMAGADPDGVLFPHNTKPYIYYY